MTRIEGNGGSGALPTGALKVGDDWPGIFIRGDEALGRYGAVLDAARIEVKSESVRAALKEFRELLDSCYVTER